MFEILITMVCHEMISFYSYSGIFSDIVSFPDQAKSHATMGGFTVRRLRIFARV